jgi:YHS domain-containing protein
METIARLLRFVMWVLVLSWALRVIGRLAGWALRRAVGTGQAPAADAENGAGAAAADGPQVATRRLVRDPVCGMHLAETLAIPFREGGELRHFCSVKCRDTYANGILRRAANA